jgi:excisionase family DNA binding protein
VAPPGAGSGGQERLTLTVEEAAAVGISRGFAYEAVARNEIPHIRIGRRDLVPESPWNVSSAGPGP